MPTVGIRELSRETRSVIEQLEATGEPVIITKQGQAIAALIVVDRARLQDLVLSAAPEFVESTREADEALASGDTRPLGELLAEMSETGPAAALDVPEAEPIVSGYADHIARISERMANIIGLEAEPSAVEQIQNLNAKLFGTYVTETLDSALERLRTVNENVVAIGKEEGELSTDKYLKLLQGVTLAERLAQPGAGHVETNPVTEVADEGVRTPRR